MIMTKMNKSVQLLFTVISYLILCADVLDSNCQSHKTSTERQHAEDKVLLMSKEVFVFIGLKAFEDLEPNQTLLSLSDIGMIYHLYDQLLFNILQIFGINENDN